MNEDLAVILLHAGRKAIKPYAYASINSQIEVIRNTFNNDIEIIVVVGFNAEKIIPTLSNAVRIIENPIYYKTTSAKSALIGLRATTKTSAYIIYDDYSFRRKTLIRSNQTYVMVDASQNNCHDVGVTVSNNVALNFSYGLSEFPRWNGFVYFSHEDIIRFKDCHKNGMLMQEVFNGMIDEGSKFEIKYDI